jgi:hypothetical protein
MAKFAQRMAYMQSTSDVIQSVDHENVVTTSVVRLKSD